jgi:hypothetical protein
VATDFNYTPQSTSSNWEQPGVSPIGQTVILTNVQSAYCVYTAYMNYPSVWDPLFRAAMVAYLASEVALSLSKDKAFGLKLRAEQIMIAKEKIKQARISDGNEGWYSTDHTPDWMRVRISGVSGANWQGMNSAASGCWGSYDSIGFADGSAF